jgi:hypothetical protein
MPGSRGQHPRRKVSKIPCSFQGSVVNVREFSIAPLDDEPYFVTYQASYLVKNPAVGWQQDQMFCVQSHFLLIGSTSKF